MITPTPFLDTLSYIKDSHTGSLSFWLQFRHIRGSECLPKIPSAPSDVAYQKPLNKFPISTCLDTQKYHSNLPVSVDFTSPETINRPGVTWERQGIFMFVARFGTFCDSVECKLIKGVMYRYGRSDLAHYHKMAICFTEDMMATGTLKAILSKNEILPQLGQVPKSPQHESTKSAHIINTVLKLMPMSSLCFREKEKEGQEKEIEKRKKEHFSEWIWLWLGNWSQRVRIHPDIRVHQSEWRTEKVDRAYDRAWTEWSQR